MDDWQATARGDARVFLFQKARQPHHNRLAKTRRQRLTRADSQITNASQASPAKRLVHLVTAIQRLHGHVGNGARRISRLGLRAVGGAAQGNSATEAMTAEPRVHILRQPRRITKHMFAPRNVEQQPLRRV